MRTGYPLKHFVIDGIKKTNTMALLTMPTNHSSEDFDLSLRILT